MKQKQNVFSLGRIERNEDNSGEPARTRAPQVNVGGAHTTHTRAVSWSRALHIGCGYQLFIYFFQNRFHLLQNNITPTKHHIQTIYNQLDINGHT